MAIRFYKINIYYLNQGDAQGTRAWRLHATSTKLQVQSMWFSVAFQGNEGRQTKGTFTDEFKVKDMKIETIIRSS